MCVQVRTEQHSLVYVVKITIIIDQCFEFKDYSRARQIHYNPFSLYCNYRSSPIFGFGCLNHLFEFYLKSLSSGRVGKVRKYGLIVEILKNFIADISISIIR